MAEQFGYSVTFDAVGHAIREAEATSDPDFRFYNKDIGASTQVPSPQSKAFKNLSNPILLTMYECALLQFYSELSLVGSFKPEFVLTFCCSASAEESHSRVSHVAVFCLLSACSRELSILSCHLQVAVFKSNAEESSTGQQSQTSMQLIFDNMSGSGMES